MPRVKVLTVARRFPAYDAPRRGAAARDLVLATADSGVDARVVSFDRVLVPGRDPEQRARLGGDTRAAYDAVARPEVLFNSPPSWAGGRVSVARLPLVLGEVGGEAEEQVHAHLDALRPFARDLFAEWRPDLIHAPNGLWDGLLAASLGHEHGIPAVVTVDETDDALGAPATVQAYQAHVGEGVRLLATSRSVAGRLASVLDVPQGDIVVLPGGAEALGGTAGEEALDPVAAKELVELFHGLRDPAAPGVRRDAVAGSDVPATAGQAPSATPAPLPSLVVASRRGLAVRLVGRLPRRLRRRLVVVVPPAGADSAPDGLAELGVRVVEARPRGRKRAQVPQGVQAGQALAQAVRTAARSVKADGGLDVVALDAVAVEAISELESEGVRLSPGGLRWLADRWDAERSANGSDQGSVVEYRPEGYWGRLHARKELSAVGQAALPTDLNVYLYRALERSIRRFARRQGLLEGVEAAFDVGAGTGYWVGVWHDLGIRRVDGCDLVPDAVARLEEKFGNRGDRFVAADVGSPRAGLPDQRYGLVSVFNVLLHITDDAAFDQALRNVSELVRPGGHLLLVEPALADAGYEKPFDPRRHSRARRLAAYVDPLVAAGLELVTVEGAVATSNNPIEGRWAAEHKAYQRWWRWVARTAKENPRRIPRVGAAMLALDRAALLTGAAPSSKFLLLRRPAAR